MINDWRTAVQRLDPLRGHFATYNILPVHVDANAVCDDRVAKACLIIDQNAKGITDHSSSFRKKSKIGSFNIMFRQAPLSSVPVSEQAYIPVLTRPVTLSSISLSFRPDVRGSERHFVHDYLLVDIPKSDSCFSLPYSEEISAK